MGIRYGLARNQLWNTACRSLQSRQPETYTVTWTNPDGQRPYLADLKNPQLQSEEGTRGGGVGIDRFDSPITLQFRQA